MKNIVPLFSLLFLFSCNPAVRDDSKKPEHQPETAAPAEVETTSEEIVIQEVMDSIVIESADHPKDWKKETSSYTHFNWGLLDTIRIGATREITTIEECLNEDLSNTIILIDEGEYIHSGDVWLRGENVIIKGEGEVSIYCNKLYDNVLWVMGNNIVIDNLHMMHLMKGEAEGQNCSGRVLAFDNADSVTVINCDLNGCGLAGLHDNLENGTIWVEHNYIHNNSIGAYTDINGGVWLDPIPNHPVFKFENNIMINNGFDRVYEKQDFIEEDSYNH